MPQFFFQFSGRERDTVGTSFTDLAEARTGAVQALGSYLAEHPGYADEGHWQVTVEDESRQPLLNVIVATVPTRRGRGV